MSNEKLKFPLDQQTFNNLKKLYIIALSAIALSVIASQLFIRRHLDNQKDDSRVINVAGRQRMLSQKLTKLVLLLENETDSSKVVAINNELFETQQLWKTSHLALQNGEDSLGLPGKNSEVISERFQVLNQYFQVISASSDKIVQHVRSGQVNTLSTLSEEIQLIKENEGSFLLLMDEIVNLYDTEANEKIVSLSRLELIITIITLLLLLAEFLFIFNPTAQRVKKSIYELLKAEEKAKDMANDAVLLIQAKEKSVAEMKAFNRAMEHTLLYARVSPDGTFTYIGDRFSRFFKIPKTSIYSKFSDIAKIHEKEKLGLEKIIANHKKTGWQGEIEVTTQQDESLWLEMSMTPLNLGGEQAELLIICVDNTERKKAQLAIEQLKEQQFNEKMNNQKVVAQKIIENQEKEQNRIAKDIHDGIGQMLTGLKFNLESIDPSDVAKTNDKVEELKALSAEIIKGIRSATFNLTPPELTDYGIVPSIAKLVKELSRLTGKNIILLNKSEFNQRLPALSEINIYRITQEAVNNAIKYAQSTHIIVSISHSEQILSITIDDNGVGFAPDKLREVKKGDGSMGLTFMKERIKLINGRFFITSSPEEGTRITLNVPLEGID